MSSWVMVSSGFVSPVAASVMEAPTAVAKARSCWDAGLISLGSIPSFSASISEMSHSVLDSKDGSSILLM